MTPTDEKVALNEKLAEVLKEVGSTPFDEPEMFEALDEKPLKKSKIVRMALDRKGLDINAFTAKEIAAFYNKLVQQFAGIKFEDGTFKSTPNTENFDLPNFEQAERLVELGIEMVGFNSSESDSSRLGEILTELDALTWEVAKLDKTKLTPWEQQLVSEQIYAAAVDAEQTSMGKQ